MSTFISRRGTRAVRVARLAALALVAAAAVAGAAGVAAARGNASASPRAGLPILNDGIVAVLGTTANDKIALRLAPGNQGVLQVDFGDNGSADKSFPLAGVTTIVLNSLAGDDQVRIDESNGIFTNRFATTIRGGAGNDTLIGGAGADTLRGDSGNDTLVGGSGNETLDGGAGDDHIDGNRGNDVAFMGAGDDTFTWDPGDGSDTIEGQDGVDTMVFNGAAAAEHVDLSANGSRLRFFRDVAGITMDTAGVERVDFNALGGADVVTVNNLAGTDVNDVNVDLAGTLGGTAGDAAKDQVIVKGTDGDDAIKVSGDANEVRTSGLAAIVRIDHSEVANDRLDLDTASGIDTLDSTGLAAGTIQLFLDGVLVP